MSSTRPIASLFIAFVGAALAFVVAQLAGFPGAVDRALPFWVLLAALAGVVAISEAAAQRIELAIPLFLGAAVAVSSDAARHLAYGLVLAGALAVALLDVAREEGISRGRALALALLVVATRAFPFEGVPVGALAILVGGIAVAIFAGVVRASRPPLVSDFRHPGAGGIDPGVVRASRPPLVSDFPHPGAGGTPAPHRGIPLLTFLLIVALALVTPLAPWDAALAPLAIALALIAVPAPGPGPGFSYRFAIAAGAALLVGLLVGKWLAAAVAIVVAARFLSERTRPTRADASPAFAFPLVASRAGGAIAALGFAPGALIAPAPAYDRVAAALLFALSLFARPQPALILGMMALLVLAPAGRRRNGGRDGRAPAAVTGALLFGAIGLTAWSGAVAASFPIFVDRELWVAFAIACAIGLLFLPAEGRAGRPHHTGAAIAVSALAAGAFVALVLLIPREPYHVEPVGIALAPGESFVLEPPLESRAIDVVVSGANVSGLPEGTRIGTLQVVDAAGVAFARPIAVGDLADWGAFRPGDLFRTRNPLPRAPGWTIGGDGREASLRGEGGVRVRLAQPIGRMIVAAAPDLPPDARLQIERMEVAQP